MSEIDELIECYKSLKKNKEVIATIDKNYFFTFVDKLLDELKRKNKTIDDMSKVIVKENIHKKYCFFMARSTECYHNCKDCIKQIFETC